MDVYRPKRLCIDNGRLVENPVNFLSIEIDDEDVERLTSDPPVRITSRFMEFDSVVPG